jgi:hypothetical protein
MNTKSFATQALKLLMLALTASACEAPSAEELEGSSQALTASDLIYNASTGTFSRTVIREIQVTNPKQFPFRIDESSSVTVALEWLPEADPSRNWDSSRPSTYAVSFSSDGVHWTTANAPAGCVQTAQQSSPTPASCTFQAGADAAYALIEMSTTQGSQASDIHARFALQYTFTGPSDVNQSERPTSTTLNVTNLSDNVTQKAYLDAAQTILPGAFEGQGVQLVIERSHPNVIDEPNGPKLKDRAQGNEQYDGVDFVCGAWVNIANTSPQRARKTCSIEDDTTIKGAVTRDSLIHVPFLVKPGTATSGRWAKVTIHRDYVNGYVRQ